MQICERCEQSNNPITLMRGKLIERGIDPELFYQSTPEERQNLILECVKTEKNVDYKSCPEGLGLVVAKPEIFIYAQQIERYMVESRGLKIVDSQPFTYTPEAYYSVYKRIFTDCFPVFPHGSLLMLISMSLPSRAIIFHHTLTTNDPQALFNQTEKSGSQLSIRQNVVFPIVQSLGFADMEKNLCSGKCFDPARIFTRRPKEANLKTFNGLHIPNDKEELDITFSALSTIIKSWTSL